MVFRKVRVVIWAGCLLLALSACAGDPPDDSAWTPSWADEHGCEPHEHWVWENCVENNREQRALEADCWHSGIVNDWGLGRACKPGERDCSDIEGSCCLVDKKRYGAFCTRPCGLDDDCPEGFCHPSKELCMPDICRELIFEWYPAHRKKTKGFECPLDNIAASGLGTLCTSGEVECAGLEANICLGEPAQLEQGDPTITSFCTKFCEIDEDCGDSATCVHANGPPYFCSPTSCAEQFSTFIFSWTPISGAGDSCTWADPDSAPLQ